MLFGAMQGILGTNDPAEAIMRAAYWGFDSVELITKSGANGELLIWNFAEKQAIMDAIKESGIQVSSLCVGSFNQSGFVNPGTIELKEVKQGLRELIVTSKELNAGIILVPFFGNNRIRTEDDKNKAIEGILDVIPVAEEYKITLALEMTVQPEVMIEIIDKIESQCIGIYYDIGNMTAEGFDNANAIRELGGYISAVHIKDRKIGGGNVPLGEGDVDFESVRNALDDIGYNQIITLETPVVQNPELEARKNLAFIKKIYCF